MSNEPAVTKTLSAWLSELLTVYGRAKTEEMLAPYVTSLAHLSQAHLDLAFTFTLKSHRSSFLPTPGEILSYLEIAVANLPPAGPNSRPDCPHCFGTGYAIVEMTPNNRVAVRCRCLVAKGATAGKPS